MSNVAADYLVILGVWILCWGWITLVGLVLDRVWP